MLEINWWVVGLTVVNFLIVVLIIKKLLLKPVLKILAERKAMVASEILEAQTQKETALKLLETSKAELEAQRANASKIVSEALSSTEARQQLIIKEAKKQAREIIEQAHLDIQMERERSLREHQADIADLSVAMAEQLLAESIRGEVQTRLIDDFIDELVLDEPTEANS